MNRDDSKLVAAAKACAKACDSCAKSCLEEADAKALAECVRLDRDCADMCRFVATLMDRDSRFAKQVCQLCITIAEACAAECNKHAMDHCRECARACLELAEACRAVLTREEQRLTDAVASM